MIGCRPKKKSRPPRKSGWNGIREDTREGDGERRCQQGTLTDNRFTAMRKLFGGPACGNGRYGLIYRPILQFEEGAVRWQAESSILFSFDTD